MPAKAEHFIMDHSRYSRLGSIYLGKIRADYGTDVFRGRKPKVKVIDIGPDPPGTFRRYIWGRSRKCYVLISVFSSFFFINLQYKV